MSRRARQTLARPEEDFAGVVLQQELVRDDESLEHPDDVAVLNRPAMPTDAAMPAVTKGDIVDDLVLRKGRAFDAGGAEETHDGAARAEHPNDLPGKRLAGTLVEKIEDIPAKDAVGAGITVSEALLECRRQVGKRGRARMPVHFADQVFDEEFASQPLAEELHVAPDDRTEVDQDWRRLLSQRVQELGQGLGSNDHVLAVARPRWIGPGGSGTLSSPLQEISQHVGGTMDERKPRGQPGCALRRRYGG